MTYARDIAVIGTGYVGLVLGTCLADHGRHVTCIDKDAKKIEFLKSGHPPFYEPGLETLITRNTASERLRFTTEAEAAIQKADLIFLAVGTPPKGDGETDLSQVLSTAETIGKNLKENAVILVKSTVPVGTTLRMKNEIAKFTDKTFHIGFNPEFLREGAAVSDFMNPDRTIIGSEAEVVNEMVRDLYKSFISSERPLLVTDIYSAEMIKYTANAMLATRISFMNDISVLCDKLGADVEVVKKGIGLDDRIGQKFLNPGIGVGGSCFPKDLKSLVHTGKVQGEEMPILRGTLAVNARMPLWFTEKIKTHFNGNIEGKRFYMWGLAFKPNTDDMREAPSIAIIEDLMANGAKIVAFDPVAMENAKAVMPEGVRYTQRMYDELEETDALLLLTEWNEFKNPDWAFLKKRLNKPVIFDGRNLYSLDEMKKEGFTYYSMGRPPIIAPV